MLVRAQRGVFPQTQTSKGVAAYIRWRGETLETRTVSVNTGFRVFRGASHGVPSYRHHKPSGKAVVTLNSRDFYLSPWQSAESKSEYDRLITEWTANGRMLPLGATSSDLTISELGVGFLRHAAAYYSNDGETTSEYTCLKDAIRPLHDLYSHSGLMRLTIDELYLGKRHKFITLVVDLQTRAVVSVASGRGLVGLRGFFLRLKRAQANVRAVTTDMAGDTFRPCCNTCPKPSWCLTIFM